MNADRLRILVIEDNLRLRSSMAALLESHGHLVDFAALGLGDLGRPEGFAARQVAGWTDRWGRAKTTEVPDMDRLAARLAERIPDPQRAVLLHNDFKLDNTMIDAAGEVVAVFDWDMCTVGDPLADLGTVLASWLEASDGVVNTGAAATMPSNVPGFMTRREAVARYGERRGVDMKHIGYYYVFGLFKIAVVLQQIYVRYHRGQTKDERFAPFEFLAEGLFHMARMRRDEPGL